MKTSFSENKTDIAIKQKIKNFYDIGSPLYFEVYGKHIHDGYYITGKESKQEAQENLTKLLVEKAGIKKGAKVLDVGCGIGGSSIWMAENLGANTAGITLSPVQADIARKLASERHVDSSFIVMDAENMNFEEPFDVIWVVAAMTHFQDEKEFIKHATKFIKPGGKFVVFDWMLEEHGRDSLTDKDVSPVAEKMLLSSMHPMNEYLKWFMDDEYRITFAEDVTLHTIQTWDDALAVIKEPAVLKLASRISKEQVTEIIRFFTSIGAMKKAMQKGKIIAGIVIAEKL